MLKRDKEKVKEIVSKYLSSIKDYMDKYVILRERTCLFKEILRPTEVLVKPGQAHFRGETLVRVATQTKPVLVLGYVVNCLLGYYGVCTPELAVILGKLSIDIDRIERDMRKIESLARKLPDIDYIADPLALSDILRKVVSYYKPGILVEMVSQEKGLTYELIVDRSCRLLVIGKSRSYSSIIFNDGNLYLANISDDNRKIIVDLMKYTYYTLAYVVEKSMKLIDYLDEHADSKIASKVSKLLFFCEK